MDGHHPLLDLLRRCDRHSNADERLHGVIGELIDMFPDAWSRWKPLVTPLTATQAEPFLVGANRQLTRVSVASWSPLARLVGMGWRQCVHAAVQHATAVPSDAFERAISFFGKPWSRDAEAILNALQPARLASEESKVRLWSGALLASWKTAPARADWLPWLQRTLPLTLSQYDEMISSVMEELVTCEPSRGTMARNAGTWLLTQQHLIEGLDSRQAGMAGAGGHLDLHRESQRLMFLACWGDPEATRLRWTQAPPGLREEWASVIWADDEWEPTRQAVLEQGLREGWLPTHDAQGKARMAVHWQRPERRAFLSPLLASLPDYPAQDLWHPLRLDEAAMEDLDTAGHDLSEDVWWQHARSSTLAAASPATKKAWIERQPTVLPEGTDERGVRWSSYVQMYRPWLDLSADEAAHLWRAAAVTGHVEAMQKIQTEWPQASVEACNLPGPPLALSVISAWVEDWASGDWQRHNMDARFNLWTELMAGGPSWGSTPAHTVRVAMDMLRAGNQETPRPMPNDVDGWEGFCPTQPHHDGWIQWWGRAIQGWGARDFDPSWDRWWMHLGQLAPERARLVWNVDAWPADVAERCMAAILDVWERRLNPDDAHYSPTRHPSCRQMDACLRLLAGHRIPAFGSRVERVVEAWERAEGEPWPEDLAPRSSAWVATRLHHDIDQPGVGLRRPRL